MVQIPVEHGHLEALFREAEGEPRGQAVLCHPHPLHGGTLRTKAVFRAAQALNEAGIHALRFNFRGVGTSTGSFDEGVGEMEDVRAALDWLDERAPGLPVLVAGLSFGAMVGLRAGADDDRVGALLGLGLPVDMNDYDFGFLDEAGKPAHIIQGEEDEFGPGPRIQEVVDGLGQMVTLDRIPGSGHLFHDHFEELKEAVRRYVTTGGAAAVFGERTSSPNPDMERAGA